LANAHTVFNVVNGVVALALLGPLTWLIERLVPERTGRRLLRRQHERVLLDEALLSSPALALAAVGRELVEMSAVVTSMSSQIPDVMLSGTYDSITRLKDIDDEVDAHHRHVVRYLTELGRQALNEEETQKLVAALSTANDLEAIGDVIETNFVRAARHRIERNIMFDIRAEERLRDLHTEVHQALVFACDSLVDDNGRSAERSVEAKARVHELFDHIAESAVFAETTNPGALEAYTLEREIAEHLRRIAHVARRIARASLMSQ
jgi:phosphate:Na+ symporter